jgi:predicted metalloprotease with PDZ domain
MKKRFSAARIIFAEILLFAFACAAQEVFVNVKILPDSNLQIEGKFADRSIKNWGFTNSIAGISIPGERVSDFSLFDKQKRAIAVKKLAENEYLADEKADEFVYRINIKPLPTAATMAHVSWISNEKGLLMLDDLLPQFSASRQTISGQIKFELPNDWKIISNEKSLGENAFYVKDVEKAVFLVGKDFREQKIQIGETTLNLAIFGEWKFSDAEATAVTGEIFGEYEKLFGEAPAEKAQIFLIRFPNETKFGRWQAETRGATLSILSSDMPFKSQSIQRLHEQMRHELLHLWMPNNLALTGSYDWFYEGFTIYQALRTGVSMNQIRFEDFLDTLSQAYNFDRLQNRTESLVESSKTRWRGTNNPVYARGMLAAFLTDVALLRKSKGKRSIENVFREIYQKHRVPHQIEEGNSAILKILRANSELNSVIEKYITGAEKINWETDLESLGIESTDENYSVRLKVKAKLNNRQKDLLNELGYNNWRKTSRIGK